MDLKALEALLDKKLRPLATKDDLNLLKETIDGVIQQNIVLTKEIDDLKIVNTNLIKRIEALENRGRKNNLIFWGLNPNDESDCSTLVEQFVSEKLKLETRPVINSASILRTSSSNKAIIAHFPKYNDIINILTNCNKLAGTRFSVQRDFSAIVRRKRAKLLALSREVKMKTRCKSKLVHDQLLIEGDKFSISDNLGDIVYKNGCGYERFHQLTGLDALIILHQYEKNKNLK